MGCAEILKMIWVDKAERAIACQAPDVPSKQTFQLRDAHHC